MLAIAGVVFFIGLVVLIVLGGLTILRRIVGVWGGKVEVTPLLVGILAGSLAVGFTVWMVTDIPKAATGDSVLVNFMGEDVAAKLFGGGLPGSDLFTGTPVP